MCSYKLYFYVEGGDGFRKTIYVTWPNCSFRAGGESGEKGFTDSALRRDFINASIFPTGSSNERCNHHSF